MKAIICNFELATKLQVNLSKGSAIKVVMGRPYPSQSSHLEKGFSRPNISTSYLIASLTSSPHHKTTMHLAIRDSHLRHIKRSSTFYGGKIARSLSFSHIYKEYLHFR